jgi:transcriptional regulator with XRE-family HTH domain
MNDMASERTEHFRANLAKLCDGYGNSRRISTAAGITATHLWKITTGKTIPGLDLAFRIADAVGIPLEELSTANPKAVTRKIAAQQVSTF